jgi:hypothetical protein
MAKLTNNERSPFTDVVRLTFNDIIANTTALQAGTFQIATIPAGGAIDLVAIARPEGFTATSTLTLSVGTTSGTPTELMAAGTIGGSSAIAPLANTGSLFVLAPGATYSQATASTVKGGALPVNATATAVPVYAKTSAALTSGETTGVVVIGLRIIDTAQYLA